MPPINPKNGHGQAQKFQNPFQLNGLGWLIIYFGNLNDICTYHKYLKSVCVKHKLEFILCECAK